MPERDAAGAPGPSLLLDLTAPTTHLVQARLQFTPPQQRLVLRLPAWTPGSYLIRDYVSRLESLEVVQAGNRVALERLEVAAWVVDLPDSSPVEARWRIQATEPSVRTCELGADHGFLALAGVFLAKFAKVGLVALAVLGGGAAKLFKRRKKAADAAAESTPPQA